MRKLDKNDPLTLQAAEMYKRGATLKEAAAVAFISPEALRTRFENAGIVRRSMNNQKLAPAKVEEIRNDRANGKRCTEIARIHGVSPAAVSHYTRDISQRQRTEKRKRGRR